MNAIIFATEHWRDHEAGWWFPLFPLLFVGLWVLVVGRRWRRWGPPVRRGRARRTIGSR